MTKGELRAHKQGKHQKTSSLLSDEDVLKYVLEGLRNCPPEQRGPRKVVELVELRFRRKISERTALRWLTGPLGYELTERGKGIYHDGHEREDVVLQRKEFVERQRVIHWPRMEFWEGGDDGGELIRVPRQVMNQPLLVPVTQDES